MSDLDERLRAGLTTLAERIEPAASPDDVLGELDRVADRRARRWLVPAVAAAVALVVLVGVMTVVARSEDDATDVYVGPPTTDVATDVWNPQSLGPGWHELPAPPLETTRPRSMVWTGHELIVWRGDRSTFSADQAGGELDGAASFDPVTMTWELLPADPLAGAGEAGEIGAGGAWTGTEAIFWSAQDDPLVAWNPETETWRTTSTPPLDHQRDAIWTGDELIFWADGLAYAPVEDRWREIAFPSVLLRSNVNENDDSVIWTGEEIVVVGGLTGAYDPRTDTWREFGVPLPGEAGSPGVVWDGLTAAVAMIDGQVVAFDGSPDDAAVLDLAAGTWRSDQSLTPPFPSFMTTPVVVPLDGGRLFVQHDSTYVRDVDGTWTEYPPGDPGQLVAAGTAVFRYGANDVREPELLLFVPPEVALGDATDPQFAPLVQLDASGLHAPGPKVGAWSGRELLLFGGNDATDRFINAGSAFDPASGSWRAIPASPLTDATGAGGAWTGTELVVWSRGGVAMWNPESGAWRSASPSKDPVTVQWPEDAAWTGGVVRFWKDGFTYDPASDEWSAMALPPISPSRASASWSGDTLYVTGLRSEQIPVASVALAYDVVTDTWRALPESGLDGQALDTVWVGDRLVGVDYSNHTIVYDTATGTWSAQAPIPLDFGEDWPMLAAVGDVIVLNSSAGAAVLRPLSPWQPIDRPFASFGQPIAGDGGVFIVGDGALVWLPVP